MLRIVLMEDEYFFRQAMKKYVAELGGKLRDSRRSE